jgi:hypothetical protein
MLLLLHAKAAAACTTWESSLVSVYADLMFMLIR